MAESLSVPTATSTREIPVKVLEENRHAINRHQQGLHLPKVSFTHLIAWAMVQAMRACRRWPASSSSRTASRSGGSALAERRHRRRPARQAGDGRRSLVVPNVKDCGAIDFAGFFAAYMRQIEKARKGKLGRRTTSPARPAR
jgi:2-oxoglutarate decarboxylase